ncbi:unnamed protein product [Ostreobium quekettii]|uniref:Uncharacterized protein n=1 Tax=Ostreobium quekettii TaxID=121088 RepID=A0A8S1ILD5_9CHLO|nr:unnamed protein product [Ostreobium quekettii]
MSVHLHQIDNCLKRTAAFVAAFNALIQLAKAHATRVQVPAVTVKCSGRFVAEFIKTMPFWEHVYAAHQGEFVSLVKEMQKATKVVQALCSEAKSRKAMNLTTKVPAVKRVLERFIFVIKAFFHKVNRPEAFWMGNLKHKNLQGQQIASQIEAETRVEDSLSGSSTDASDTEDGNSEDSMPVHAASTRFQAGACDEEGMDEDTSDCI